MLVDRPRGWREVTGEPRRGRLGGGPGAGGGPIAKQVHAPNLPGLSLCIVI